MTNYCILCKFAIIILTLPGETMKIVQIAVVFCLIAISGCKGPTGLDGAVGSQLQGDIFGYVDVYDWGGRLVADRRGVQITTDKETSTPITDSTGRWTLKNLYAGIYNISASKPGYTTANAANFQFVGGGNAYLSSTLGIIQLPTYTISGVALAGNITDSLGQQLKIDISPSAALNENRYFMIVYGKVPTVGINTNDALVTSSVTFNYRAVGSATFSLRTAITTLQNTHGMKSGEKVYAVVYPSSASVTNVGSYIDPVTKKTVYTRVTSPFVAVNFQIP